VTPISENKSFFRCLFDVLENSNNCIPMTDTRRVKELTYDAKWKRYVWSSQGEIIQFSHQSSVPSWIRIWLPLIRKEFYNMIHRTCIKRVRCKCYGTTERTSKLVD